MSISFEIEKISPIVNEEIDYDTLIFKINCPKKVNIDNGKDLWIFFKTIIDGGVKKIIINLKDLDFIDSSGIGILINTAKLIRSKNGEFVMCNSSPDIKNVFKIINLQNFIKVYNTEHEAIDSFRYL